MDGYLKRKLKTNSFLNEEGTNNVNAPNKRQTNSTNNVSDNLPIDENQNILCFSEL